MKRLLALAAVTILAVCLAAGCGGTKPGGATGSGSKPPDEIASYTDPLTTITAAVNEEFIISLEFSGTGTGYEWFEDYDTDILELVEKQYMPAENPGSMFGTPPTQNFRFKTLKRGNSKIVFAFRQSWVVLPERQAVFYIEVP